MTIPLPDDEEDISEYKFSKFSTMYFQSNHSHSYIRRALREPLLPLKSDGDKLVSGASTHGCHLYCKEIVRGEHWALISFADGLMHMSWDFDVADIVKSARTWIWHVRCMKIKRLQHLRKWCFEMDCSVKIYCKHGNFRVGVIFTFFMKLHSSWKFSPLENKTHMISLRKWV